MTCSAPSPLPSVFPAEDASPDEVAAQLGVATLVQPHFGQVLLGHAEEVPGFVQEGDADLFA